MGTLCTLFATFSKPKIIPKLKKLSLLNNSILRTRGLSICPIN